MKINVEHMLRMAGKDAGGAFRHSLPELADDLRELRDRSRRGPGEAVMALDEFFDVYVFGDESLTYGLPEPKRTPPIPTVNPPRNDGQP